MVSYVIETILFMVAAIGALLLGFELLSSNVTKLFHSQLKKLFNKTSKNDLIGVGIGAAATAIVQSSGATTVMTILMTIFFITYSSNKNSRTIKLPPNKNEKQ